MYCKMNMGYKQHANYQDKFDDKAGFFGGEKKQKA